MTFKDTLFIKCMKCELVSFGYISIEQASRHLHNGLFITFHCFCPKCQTVESNGNTFVSFSTGNFGNLLFEFHVDYNAYCMPTPPTPNNNNDKK